MRLALFDLDNTLLLGDSDHGWLEYLVTRGLVDSATFKEKNDQFLIDYQNGTLDIHAFLEFQLSPLKNYRRDELENIHQQYMEDVIHHMITDFARQLVKSHQDQGDMVAIVTATNRFVTGPIAEAFGIDHLIATEIEEENGQYTGKPLGEPNFQAGKINNVNAWLAKQGKCLADFEKSYFYSDSINDLPLLRTVTNPIAVNPDSKLRSIAEKEDWPIICFQQC